MHRKNLKYHVRYMYCESTLCNFMKLLFTTKMFKCSFHMETYLGLDGTRLKQNAQARLKMFIIMLD